MDRLYISGPVGSGKSTLARRLSEMTGIPCFELDGIVYEPDPDSPDGNRKRPEAERDRLFAEILAAPRWIAEDAGRLCFMEAYGRADEILLLEPSPAVRRARIVRRWVRQNLRLERCGYRPTLSMLKAMFRWSRDYEAGRDTLKQRLAPFWGKVTVVRNGAELKKYCDTVTLREEAQ